MHPRISVHGFCGSSSSLAEDLAFWADAGIPRVGIPMPKLDGVAWDQALGPGHAARDEGIEQILRSGVSVCHVTAVKAFDLTDPSVWTAQREALVDVVDVARALSAERLCVTAGPSGVMLADDTADAFSAAFAPVKEYAHGLGLPVAIEHNHVIRRDLGFLNTLSDAVAYARQADLKVCAEVQNFWVEPRLKSTIEGGLDVIDLVQISDWVQTDSTVPPSRAALGDGDLPLEQILSWFLDAGYEGAFDIELVGPRIDAEGYQTAVTRSVAWLTAALGRLGA